MNEPRSVESFLSKLADDKLAQACKLGYDLSNLHRRAEDVHAALCWLSTLEGFRALPEDDQAAVYKAMRVIETLADSTRLIEVVKKLPR